MIDKKIEELILVYKQLLAETVILKKEMIRVRGKLESNLN